MKGVSFLAVTYRHSPHYCFEGYYPQNHKISKTFFGSQNTSGHFIWRYLGHFSKNCDFCFLLSFRILCFQVAILQSFKFSKNSFGALNTSAHFIWMHIGHFSKNWRNFFLLSFVIFCFQVAIPQNLPSKI